MEESVFTYCKVDFAICLRFTRSFFFDLYLLEIGYAGGICSV